MTDETIKVLKKYPKWKLSAFFLEDPKGLTIGVSVVGPVGGPNLHPFDLNPLAPIDSKVPNAKVMFDSYWGSCGFRQVVRRPEIE